jgi:uncharacterized RmlC-like cupin family protein
MKLYDPHLPLALKTGKWVCFINFSDDVGPAFSAGPGDFTYVPPFVPHQEINGKPDEPLVCVLVRSDQEPFAVNLNIPAVDEPEEVCWGDPAHPKP